MLLGLSIFLFLVSIANSAPTKIPYYSGRSLSVDSGYIAVDKIRLFYLHVASLQNPSTDPLVFWFQGGPGGSSMIAAFLEMGPFIIHDAKHLSYKSLNWLIPGANMVFIDQPACVGFSYSSNLADCNTSDTKAAAVNVRAIKSFIQTVMPQYKNRKFWFTGESYAGAYVPMLSAHVVDDPALIDNFAGFMVGNPVMECYDKHDPQSMHVGDTWTYFNQLYWNGYIPQEGYELWRKAGCDSDSHRRGVPMPACDNILNIYNAPSNLGADFDPDDAFTDPCTGNGTLEFATGPNCVNESGNFWNLLTDYLIQPVVTQAFHADITWNSKSSSFNYTQDAFDMPRFYQHVLRKKPDVRILIYSGLSDIFTVPFSYTMPCVHELIRRTGVKVTTPWKLWHSNPMHHLGHWQQWSNNLTYATVRGAGHEVPTFQPYSAMIMFDRFIHTFGLNDN